jgi:nitroimidazol reductase NimA-like FMN-containing flavoprotein (pyridoxamine 5'-phosphate oxidase superfamily)
MEENGLKEMEKVLNQAEVGRIAFSDGFLPYIIPLNFVYHEGKIAFHCAWEGKKLELIKKNPNCCFEVDEFMGEVSYHYDSLCHLDYDSVLAFGKARIENGVKEKLRFFQLLHAKYKEIYRKPLSKGGIRFEEKNISEACCVVIDIKELTGRYERTVEEKRIKKVWSHTF